jgi:hypothetical protein
MVMSSIEKTRRVPKRTHRHLMWEHGYVPAQVVADSIGRALSTVHRWFRAGKVEGVRSDKRLFVKLDTVIAMFKGNDVVIGELRELRRGRWLREA